MAFQSVPDTIECVIDWLINGETAANTLKFTKVGGYSSTDLDNILLTMDGQVATYFLPLLSSDIEYVQVRARGLANDPDIVAANGNSAGPGAIAEPTLPNNVSLCTTFRTALTGRSYRGRFYSPPPIVSQMDTANLVGTSYAASLLAAINAVIFSGPDNGFVHVVVSRFSGGSPRGFGIATPVTSVVNRNRRVDSQRGRLGTPA